MSCKPNAPQLTPQFPVHGPDNEIVLLPVHREAVWFTPANSRESQPMWRYPDGHMEPRG